MTQKTEPSLDSNHEEVGISQCEGVKLEDEAEELLIRFCPQDDGIAVEVPVHEILEGRIGKPSRVEEAKAVVDVAKTSRSQIHARKEGFIGTKPHLFR